MTDKEKIINEELKKDGYVFDAISNIYDRALEQGRKKEKKFVKKIMDIITPCPDCKRNELSGMRCINYWELNEYLDSQSLDEVKSVLPHNDNFTDLPSQSSVSARKNEPLKALFGTKSGAKQIEIRLSDEAKRELEELKSQIPEELDGVKSTRDTFFCSYCYERNVNHECKPQEYAICMDERVKFKKLIEEIPNPYPFDVFNPLSRKERQKVTDALTEAGFTSARIHGVWGHSVWESFREDLLKSIEGMK